MVFKSTEQDRRRKKPTHCHYRLNCMSIREYTYLHERQRRHKLKIEQKGDRVKHKIPNEAEVCAAMAVSTNYTVAKTGVSMVDAGENQGTSCIRALKYWTADTAGDFILLEAENLLVSSISSMSSAPELCDLS